jgi:DNA-binding CsgD family transcriptional regulator
LKNGFFYPSHHGCGTVTGVILAGASVDAVNPDLRTAARILAAAYETNGQRLRGRISSPSTVLAARPKLSLRQLECLQWVAGGKTSVEIASLLNLSAKTVDEHIDNACRGFGVNGRMQAVVQAIKFGLIRA